MKANEAFKNVCNLISEKYLDSGWKYSKSSRWMTKKDKNFIYKIFFYTSWNNISDKNVAFYGECAIIPLKSKDKIFHINTQQCNVPSGQLYWNIANGEDWGGTVNEFTNWLDSVFMPIVERCMNDLDNFVKEVVIRGFYPPKGYVVDISFILMHGSRELAEEAIKRYYASLEESIKREFKGNYESMIYGNEAVSAYGNNMMRNYSNFRTIIDNKIVVTL
ncbi:hypothetical protein SAMN04488168_1369 [Bacillus sp. 491mf]|uniref:hypothetical protein n=1 Tax=Bacillus sp. 491mf TaxID=1761755 RepID=UPI0008F3C962|nr:hypothetical protein [Bacillus sp. 491mf]SFD38257.1 hypothetical protein SAMN04488168_1369 [Bacillus sp. 491mf]